MLKRVAAILCTVVEFDPDTVTGEHNLIDDLGLSSLDVINLTILFEQEFDIEIPDRHIMQFITVGDIAAYLQKRTESA
jgi:acyl carrier protein